jgi:hypothetical protein
VLDTGVEVGSGAWSSSVPQQSGEHWATLGKHQLGALGEHMREAAAAHRASTYYRGLSKHPRAAGRAPLGREFFLD